MTKFGGEGGATYDQFFPSFKQWLLIGDIIVFS